jgi:PAS domain S-box-containing protein
VNPVDEQRLLRESEEKYRALVETTGTGYVIIDSEGRVLDANREYIRLTGHQALEEIRGRRVTEWTAPHDLARNAEEVGKCMERGFVHNLEIDYVTGEGKVIPVEINATVLPMAEGTRIVTLCRDISERRRVEDQLRVKDWVIEWASNAFAISDLAGNLNYVNPAFLKLWGFRTREEILGKPAMGFWQMGEKAAEVIEGLRTRGGWSGEMVAKSKEGALFDVQVVASLVLDDVGRPFCMSASFIDNTEHKRVEKALQESEQRFKAIFDHSNDGILLADMETKRFFIGNETICKMLGCSPDEIKDLGVMDIHPAEDIPYVIDQFEKQARKEIAIAKDLPVKRKDGSIFYADVNAFPITLAGKTYLVGAFRDTTERKQAEEFLQEQKEELEAANEDLQQSRDALRESEGKHRTLLENLPQKIFFKDRSSVYVVCNENYARDLKIPSDEIQGRTDHDFFPRELAEKYRSDDRRIMESGRTEEFEERYLHEGQERWVYTIKTPVKNEAGEVVGILGIFWDTTERKNLEAQLIQSQKMEAVGMLAGGIAHEFNNILGGILGYASLMRLKMEPDHPFWGYVEIIEKSSQRAAALTSQLLGFARKGKYDLRLLNLNLLAEDTLAIVRQTFDRAVTVEARLAESLPNVEGDTMQLQQVLMNLCINARDAMPKGGSLVLTTGTEQVAEGDERMPLESKPGSYVLLSVADTGCGMDEETQAKIFQPFFTTKEKGKGTGLGLAMVYGVVKNHGGFVTIRSEVGRGSAFTLHLPAAEKPIDRRPEALAVPEKSRGAVPGQTILVVDD